MDYPIAKPSELADILIPEEDEGILKKTGVVDVFHNLRGVDEASFAGGEYLIVKCDNAKMWELLEAKGHVVGRNKKYACIYWPYHMMGLESPITILLGDLLGIGTPYRLPSGICPLRCGKGGPESRNEIYSTRTSS